MARLWLRWSWRDLRARWLQVAAIALIIALGSGVYSGLSSGSRWRRLTYDDGFAALHMYDLRVSLSTGNYADPERLLDAVHSVEHARWIDRAETRLIGPTQVDASTRGKGGKTILVPGRIVGVDVAHGGPQVNAVDAVKGRTLRGSDAGKHSAVLDVHFAKHYHLPDTGRVRLSGGRVDYVGQGLSPEYFLVMGEQGNLLAEANFAVLFTPVETAQQLLGQPGLVNDVVLTLRPGADPGVVRTEIERALVKQLPQAGFTVMTRRDDRAYRTLYDDIENDQKLFTIFALLILAGAAFAAFNLTGRIVEAQRREIGIGMALGTPPRQLAIRPLLVGGQVALLGVVFGVGIGLLVDSLIGGLYRGFQPMPSWQTPFQPLTFLRGAALGLFLPFIATVIPVRRAVRVTPVEAIRTGYLSAKGGGLAPLLARVPIPGNSFVQMPFRNVLRAPRRTLLTLLGIGAAIVVLIGVVGMVDSFVATIDAADHEILKQSPDRLTVQLDRFYPETAPQVTAIGQSKLVSRATSSLSVGGALKYGGKKLDVLVDLFDLEHGFWSPTIQEGRLHADQPAVIVAEKAARDLGVHAGDTITLRHPLREGFGYHFVETKVPIAGIDKLPTRSIVFMDIRFAGLMNLQGIVNTASVLPARGVSQARIERALFGRPGIASVQPISAYTNTIRKALEERLGILDVVQAAVLLLALLIAFNSTSISVDERAREQATMFAYGLPVRVVMSMTVVESVVTGLLGTAVGVAVGRGVLEWLIKVMLPNVIPELGINATLSAGTLLTAFAFGVFAVAVAPLFTLRKLLRMDIPSTLRVME